MTRRQYVDILQAETAGGNITDEVRIDYRLMGALLDIARESHYNICRSKESDTSHAVSDDISCIQ
jgi:hypothetical protein